MQDTLSARIREDGSLVVRCADESGKQAMIAGDPVRCSTTPHHDGYPSVLLRLGELDVDGQADGPLEAWRMRASRPLVDRFDAGR